MLDKFDSACPVVRTGPTRIARHIDVSDGLRIYQTVIFERQILWLRETSSELRLTGLREPLGSTHSDFYGYLTSPDEHLARFDEVMAEHDVGPDGRRELSLVVTVEDIPALRDTTTEAFVGRAAYCRVPRDWMDADHPDLARYLAADWDARTRMPSPYINRESKRDLVLASSRWKPAEKMQRRAAALEDALTDVPDEIAARARRRLLVAQVDA
jgi:hypothetical protein